MRGKMNTVRSFLRNPTREKERMDDRLASIKVPTLVAWGKQDKLLPIAAGERYAAGIAGAKLVSFEKCGHVPAIEKTEEFLAAVVAFLAARLRRSDRGMAKATEGTRAQDFENARSTESAPEPLIMMARAMASTRRWYSMPSPF